MYYYKARIYSPKLGRFMQTDPIGYEDNVNLYGYVANDLINNVDPTGEETHCLSDGSSCVTIVDTQPSGSSPVVASNGPADGGVTALGNPNLDSAASEVAGELNQTSGNERVYRMDEASVFGVPIVLTSEVPTLSSSPSGASFDPAEMDGADAALHTEPTRANTGGPGDGDSQIPSQLGIANYQAYGTDVNAVEMSNGTVQVRPVNHTNKRGLRRQVRTLQRKIR